MTDPTIPPITEDDIAHYLANTPDFFERHASLLAAVQLTSPHSHRAVSLQERQAEMLREKIKGLELKAAEMIRHGHENTAIADRLQRWTLQLLNTRTADDLPTVVTEGIATHFDVPQVAVRLWGVAPAFAGLPQTQGASDEAQALASALTQPSCRSHPAPACVDWLADPAAAASLALLPLRTGDGAAAFGLLVLASPDAQRFTPAMGTDFLARIGELSAAALSRLLP